jgi:hypothetical protein
MINQALVIYAYLGFLAFTLLITAAMTADVSKETSINTRRSLGTGFVVANVLAILVVGVLLSII